MGDGVAHDGEPEAFEAVVDVLKEVVVDVELGNVVVGVEVLFDAFLKKGKGAKYSAQTAGCQHGGAYQAVEIVGNSQGANVAAFLVLDRGGVVCEAQLVGGEAEDGAGEELVPSVVELRAGMAHEGVGRGAVLEQLVDMSHRGGRLGYVSDKRW